MVALLTCRKKTRWEQWLVDSFSGALASQMVTEAFKGRLGPDGNRADSVKAKTGFTARRTCRAVAKAELSEPTLHRRMGEDHRIKATPGITG